MTIPSNITTAWNSLQAQVNAAKPLNQASHATVTALQLNAGNLVASIQSALTATSTLDSWAAPADAISIVAGFNNIVTAAGDQSTLSLMLGVAGRAAANLDMIA